ncbi:MAG: TetR/AcrR family transcriptional regulator [Desulfatibacillum sp.]|nr:TetR/AcrR family transcriptional regulator [Desulfatibacillum sp.]
MPTIKEQASAGSDRAEQKRAEILAAAMDAFAENGYHATKISDIAGRLGMGHGTFYRYFENKLDIFVSVIDLIIEKITSIVETDYPTATNSAAEYHQQIIRLGERIFQVFRADMRFGTILFYEALGVDQALNSKLETMLDMIAMVTELYFKNGVEKGFLRQDLDTLVLSKAITGVLVAGVRDVLAAKDPEATTKRWSKAIAGLMIGGMG